MRRLNVLIVVVMMLAGCSTASTAESSAPAASRSETPEPAPSETTPAESPVGAPSGECDPGTVCQGPVAGEITSTSTGATITMTIPDDGWMGVPDLPGVGFAVFRDDHGDFTGISVTSFSGEVFAEPCDFGAGTTEIEDTPDAFVAWLSEREGISAAEPVETTVGGRRAVSVDVTTQLPEACTEPPWIFLWSLPEVGDFHLEDGETARFYAVEGAEATVIVAVEAFPNADWDAFLAEAESVIATMEVDGGG